MRRTTSVIVKYDLIGWRYPTTRLVLERVSKAGYTHLWSQISQQGKISGHAERVEEEIELPMRAASYSADSQ
jgi:hypothetical protein